MSTPSLLPGRLACLAAGVLLVGLAATGCRSRSSVVLDPLLYRDTPVEKLTTVDTVLLRELYDRTNVPSLTRENAHAVIATLIRSDPYPHRLLEVKNISADHLSETDQGILRKWVADGGILWLRSSSSLESYFGIQWRARRPYNLLDRRLLRDNQEILPHYLTRGVRQLRILGLGTYLPVTPYAKDHFEPVLRNETNCAFGILHLGRGMVVLDSCGMDPEDANPFFGISGFDASVFWANFITYVGIMKPQFGFDLAAPATGAGKPKPGVPAATSPAAPVPLPAAQPATPVESKVEPKVEPAPGPSPAPPAP